MLIAISINQLLTYYLQELLFFQPILLIRVKLLTQISILSSKDLQLVKFFFHNHHLKHLSLFSIMVLRQPIN